MANGNAKNQNKKTSARPTGRRRPDVPAYARGNENWNTANYKASVKTAHTDTKVFKNPAEVAKGAYYYDNTVSAKRERRRRDIEKRREAWRESARKNRRRRVAVRRFLSLFIILSAVISVAAVSYKLFFVASDIKVSGETTYTPKEIISAAGLGKKVNLFSFSTKSAASSISFYCPKIARASISRSVPNKVEIKVEEEKPVYYTEIYGDTYGLSKSLRVLEKIGMYESKAGLIKLKLQTVSYAVTGDRIVLESERAQNFLENVTAMLDESELKSRLTQVDLRNDFDIVMVADDKYKLIFGSQDDFQIKLRLAAATLKDEIFKSGSKAVINLEDTTKTSVIIDNSLTFD